MSASVFIYGLEFFKDKRQHELETYIDKLIRWLGDNKNNKNTAEQDRYNGELVNLENAFYSLYDDQYNDEAWHYINNDPLLKNASLETRAAARSLFIRGIALHMYNTVMEEIDAVGNL